MANETSLTLIIRAVDKATAPLRAVNAQLQKMAAPVRQASNSFKALSDEAGIPRLVGAFRGVGGMVVGLGEKAVGLGMKFLAGAAIADFALVRIVESVAESGAALTRTARAVGLTTSSYAELRYAAQHAGVSQEEFATSMEHFARGLGEAKADGGPLLEFLLRVSPALAMQARGAKTTGDALALMIKAFDAVKDPAKRAALAQAAFGRGGIMMGQAMGQGTAKLAELGRHYRELVGPQSAAATSAEDVTNAMHDTEISMLGARNAAVRALFPAVTQLAQALTGFIVQNREGIAAWAREANAAILAWVQSGGIDRLIATMKEWAGILRDVFDAIGGVRGALVLIGAYLSAGFVASLAAAAQAVWALGAAMLATPAGWVVAAIAAVAGAVYLIYKNWEPIKKWFKGLWDSVGEIFTSAKESVLAIIDAIVEPIKKFLEWSGISGALGKIFPAASWDAGYNRPMLGGSSAPTIGPAGGQTQAKVTVDFSNMPRGARVTADPHGTADLDLSMGYSLTTP